MIETLLCVSADWFALVNTINYKLGSNANKWDWMGCDESVRWARQFSCDTRVTATNGERTAMFHRFHLDPEVTASQLGTQSIIDLKSQKQVSYIQSIFYILILFILYFIHYYICDTIQVFMPTFALLRLTLTKYNQRFLVSMLRMFCYLFYGLTCSNA